VSARAAVFAMPETGHFQRLRPLISGLAGRGWEVHVFTDRRFEAGVAAAGGRFADLFADRPLEIVDDESTPFPCRYVTFAGRHAADVIEELEALDPAIVLYDTFAVVGRVAARALGIPYVNVCAGHRMDPSRVDALIENHPRVTISESCSRAVEMLRDGYGLEDASPFSYLTGLSPRLNVYGEPPEFLTDEERRAFEPLGFFGSLPPAAELAALERNGGRSPFGAEEARLRAYACFGTVVWRYWRVEALAALGALADAFEERPGTRALISLAGAELEPEERRALARANVAVADRVDQWRALRDADAFVTHQGLNSTHEAIYQQVPMLSYPFFTDQPLLAERCRELGVSMPLAAAPRDVLTPEAVQSALDGLEDSRGAMDDALATASEWERRTIEGRGAVLDRIAAVAEG
jgi:UDP:flavonoid glycosyltransferase YjiC (YdhE family)